MTDDPRRIAVVTDYDGLVECLRARLAELNITHATFDTLTGLPVGYAGKVLGEARIRSLGPVSLGPFLQALALKLIVVEDVEAAERMAERWEKRVRPDYNAVRTASVGKRTINRMLPVVSREMQKRGRETYRTKTKPSTRRRIARTAARARWKRQRAKRASKPAAIPAPSGLCVIPRGEN